MDMDWSAAINYEKRSDPVDTMTTTTAFDWKNEKKKNFPSKNEKSKRKFPRSESQTNPSQTTSEGKHRSWSVTKWSVKFQRSPSPFLVPHRTVSWSFGIIIILVIYYRNNYNCSAPSPLSNLDNEGDPLVFRGSRIITTTPPLSIRRPLDINSSLMVIGTIWGSQRMAVMYTVLLAISSVLDGSLLLWFMLLLIYFSDSVMTFCNCPEVDGTWFMPSKVEAKFKSFST